MLCKKETSYFKQQSSLLKAGAGKIFGAKLLVSSDADIYRFDLDLFKFETLITFVFESV